MEVGTGRKLMRVQSCAKTISTRYPTIKICTREIPRGYAIAEGVPGR